MTGGAPPFGGDHVGSFLRLKALFDARDAHKSGTLDAGALRSVEDAAIRDVVRCQENLGLQGITDDEFRRTYFHIDFLTRLSGVSTKGGISRDAYPDPDGFYATWRTPVATKSPVSPPRS